MPDAGSVSERAIMPESPRRLHKKSRIGEPTRQLMAEQARRQLRSPMPTFAPNS